MIPNKRNPYASGVQPIGGVPGQSGKYGGINPGGVQGEAPIGPRAPIPEAPIGQRVPQAPIGGVPGQSGPYGGINPGGVMPPQPRMPSPPIGGVPGQSGQYGGINPGGVSPVPPNLSGQMIQPDSSGMVAGSRPTVPGETLPGFGAPSASDAFTVGGPGVATQIGGVPGQSGRYGGINPGGGMKQEVIAALKARQRRAPRRQGRAPIGGTPGQSGQYGGINPGGLPRR